ncbi:MAG: hemerythrin domain-containing protein [Chloroflexi bacterium]|nr:hemerythrin domain-containing protein [Chloroflexota bacterium]
MTTDYLKPLREGHAVAQQRLTTLMNLAGEIEAGHGVAGPALDELTTFFDKELYLHFRQEEIGLFPALISAVGRAGVVAAMLEEHQSIWKAVDALEENVSQLPTAGESQGQKTAQNIKMIGRHLVGLLRAHIEKEDNMLFPLAERVLLPETLKAVGEQLQGA